jgi:hypothetical protein
MVFCSSPRYANDGAAIEINQRGRPRYVHRLLYSRATATTRINRFSPRLYKIQLVATNRGKEMMIVRRRLASAVSGWEDNLGGIASVFEVYVSDSVSRCRKWLKRRECAMVSLNFEHDDGSSACKGDAYLS